MHKIEWNEPGTLGKMRKYLVVMNNIFGTFKIGNRFDLKGSMVGRNTLQRQEQYEDVMRDEKEPLKDKDFLNYFKPIKLLASGDENRESLEVILEADAKFLAS
jgi:hypothetical protein